MRPESSGAKEKVVGPLFPCPLAMPVVLLSDARGRDRYEYATYIQYIHNIVPTEGHHQFYRDLRIHRVTRPMPHSRSGHIFMIYYRARL